MTSQVSRVAVCTRSKQKNKKKSQETVALILDVKFEHVIAKLCANTIVEKRVNFVTRFKYYRAVIEHSNIPRSKVYKRQNYGTSQILMFPSSKV
jgi:hypothetical protein